jgi:hypothetical protein
MLIAMNDTGLHAATACLFDDQTFGSAVRCSEQASTSSDWNEETQLTRQVIVWILVRLPPFAATGNVHKADQSSDD